jgi:hypothetical protein
MIQRISELPVVLTCFAYRREYFEEMEGMLQTIREHHAEWPVVVGRGPAEGFSEPTLEVESPRGKSYWTLPVALNLDGSENDWRKITRMKGWWMSRVWHEYGDLIGGGQNRLIWIDADARLGGALDIELDPQPEFVAAPWWRDPENSDYDGIRSGLLLFQGAGQGIVESIIDQWSSRCVSQIRDLPPRSLPWFDGDQEVLNEVLKNLPASDADSVLLKLEHARYCGHLTMYGVARPGTLVIHWLMSARMWWPEDSDLPWPPPEEYRRQIAIESGFGRKSTEDEPPNELSTE